MIKHNESLRPPWHVTAEAFTLVYRTKVPASDIAGSIQLAVIIRYIDSPVGSYDEFFFTPGYMIMNSAKRYTIPDIYVNSKESQRLGIKHWRLPKKLASLRLKHLDQTTDFELESGGHRISYTLRNARFSIPFTSKLLPKLFRQFIQPADGNWWLTSLAGHGRIGLAKLIESNIDNALLKNPIAGEPIICLHLKPLSFTIHPPEVITINAQEK